MIRSVAFAVVVLAAACTASSETSVGTWELAPGQELTADTDTVNVLVTERACAGGEAAHGRILPPDIDYRDVEVVVSIRVRSLPGIQICSSNPAIPHTIELSEPLGDRSLVDGNG